MRFSQLTTSTGVRQWLLCLLLASLTSPVVFAASETVTAQDFIELQEGDQAHPGFRRAHAKGLCVQGHFKANGNLRSYSAASLFNPGTTPFIGRFSIAGGDPTAPDLSSGVRSLALNFALSRTSQWRIAMNTPPVMAVNDPHTFYQQIQAIKQGPEAIRAFLDAHPESADFMKWKATYSPTDSFSDETYHSINAFYLIDADGQQQAVRWHMMPASSADVPQQQGVDALQQTLKAQLTERPVVFDWVFTLASGEDDVTKPAVKWPDSREQVIAGSIIITKATDQLEGECHGINYDPLVLPEGVTATADPILRARSAAYAESYRRRAREQLSGALEDKSDGK